MKLVDKIIIVAGGTGSVGEGIVKNLLLNGATVIVPVRTEAKGTSLKNYVKGHENLHLFDTQLGPDKVYQDLKDWVLAKFDKIDLAVASLGGWYQGSRLDQMPANDWSSVMTNNLDSHFYFAKSIVSYFHEKNEGMFVMINGGAAEMIAPGAGAMSIIATSQLTMAQVLAAETRRTNVRVHSLIAITPVITRRRAEGPSNWISAEQIGEYIVKLFGDKDDKIVHRIP